MGVQVPPRAPNTTGIQVYRLTGILNTASKKVMIKAGKTLKFESKLENWEKGMDYCAIPVPAKITEALGTHAAVLVMAVINGSEPFQVSLFPVGGGKHYIRVRKKVRIEAGLKEGDKVKVQITVQDRADIDLPDDLLKALKEESAEEEFHALTPGKKNYEIRKINEAAKAETRKKRIAEAIQLAFKEADRKIRLGK